MSVSKKYNLSDLPTAGVAVTSSQVEIEVDYRPVIAPGRFIIEVQGSDDGSTNWKVEDTIPGTSLDDTRKYFTPTRSYIRLVAKDLAIGEGEVYVRQDVGFEYEDSSGIQVIQTTNSVNTLANAPDNSIDSSVEGATISGGGSLASANNENQIGSEGSWSVIAGGYDNDNFHIAGTISGGAHHTLTSSVDSQSSDSINCTHGTIGGGSTNQIHAGEYCTIGGGGGAGANQPNEIAGNLCTISGGQGNTIEGPSSGSTISGGQTNDIYSTQGSNTISGGINNSIGDATDTTSVSSVISGGSANTILDSSYTYIAGGATNTANTVSYSSIFGGNANQVASCNYAVILGGANVDITSAAHYACAFGSGTQASIPGSLNFTGAQNSATGDAQSISFNCRQSTESATIEYLSVYGSNTYAPVPDNSCWVGSAHVVGRESATGDMYACRIDFAIERDGDAESIRYETLTEYVDDFTLATDPAINLHSTGLFRIGVTGQAAHTILWSGRVDLTQVIGA